MCVCIFAEKAILEELRTIGNTQGLRHSEIPRKIKLLQDEWTPGMYSMT